MSGSSGEPVGDGGREEGKRKKKRVGKREASVWEESDLSDNVEIVTEEPSRAADNWLRAFLTSHCYRLPTPCQIMGWPINYQL